MRGTGHRRYSKGTEKVPRGGQDTGSHVGRNNKCWRGGWTFRALGSGSHVFQCVTLQRLCGWQGKQNRQEENLPIPPKICIPQRNSVEELNIKCILQNHQGILPFFLPSSLLGSFFSFKMKSGGQWVIGDHHSLPGPHISPRAAELMACQGFQAEYKLHRQAKLFICS